MTKQTTDKLQKLSIDPEEQVACPNCHESFVLKDALTEQLIDGYQADFDSLLAQQKAQIANSAERAAERRLEQAHKLKLEEAQEALENQKAEMAAAQRKAERAKVRALEIAQEEARLESAGLAEALETKDKHLESLRANEAELRKEKLALEEQQKQLALDVQRKVDEQRKEIEASTAEAHSLQMAELTKQIEDAKKVNQELQRKLTTGSQQLQGEVLELELEELLARSFPLDEIEPVGKGKRGADVVQVVKLPSGAVCGRIVWEMKRTEKWVKAWTGKLKDDLNAVGGELAVLVSTAFPAGIDEPMLQYEDVWLVRPSLVKPLAEALRVALIESHRQKTAAAGKDEKAEALYNYVTSPQFVQKVKAVVDAYEQMRTDLEAEKSAMQRIWKKRETQIERITGNVMTLMGEIEGMSATSLPGLEAAAGLEAVAGPELDN